MTAISPTHVCDARKKMNEKVQKRERAKATPKESTGQWNLALINDWTKTWFVGT